MKIAARAAPEPDRATEILARGFRKGPCDIEAELIATSPYERSVGQAIGFCGLPRKMQMTFLV